MKPVADKKPLPDDDDEEEDMDALIEELESQDGHIDDEDDGVDEPGDARPIPEELLQTDTRMGLTDAEVLARRKKYGLNQMKEEKENLILKFLSFFVGPIQFVMEVSPRFR
jgi:H+-transporting ATPase